MDLFFSDRTIEEPVLQYVRHLMITSRLQSYTSADVQVALLGHGYNNRLYEIRSATGVWVLKVYPRGRDIRMHREYAALRLLEHIDAIPCAVWGEPAARFLDAPVLVYQKVSGRPILETGVLNEDLDRLQEVWLALHHMDPPREAPLSASAGPFYPDACLDYIRQTMQALPHTSQNPDPRFREAMDRLREYVRCLESFDPKARQRNDQRGRLCQVDSRLGNIIKDNAGTIRLIDWEHAGLMDPAYEIASFFWHPEASIITTTQRDRCIRTYCEHSDDAYCYDRIAVYLMILPVQWIARLLSLLTTDASRPVQPWVIPRSTEELWNDVDRYLQATRDALGGLSLR